MPEAFSISSANATNGGVLPDSALARPDPCRALVSDLPETHHSTRTGRQRRCSDITVSRTYDGRFYRGQALVTIVDQDGTLMPGATVSGTFNAPSTKVRSGSTNASGVATITSDKTKLLPADWCFSVTDVSLSGYDYDAGGSPGLAHVSL